MTDFEAARTNMLEGQIRTNDVSDPNIQRAMMAIPRERFVPKSRQSIAYMSKNVEIAPGRYLMSPRTFGKLAQAAEVKSTDLVLVVGCATGYAAAILGLIADSVVALECDGDMAAAASKLLSDLEVDNVAVVTGPLNEGLANQGPYDLIFFDGSVPKGLDELTSQLRDGGRLAAIIQDGPIGNAHVYERAGDNVTSRIVFDADVPQLPGYEKSPEFVL